MIDDCRMRNQPPPVQQPKGVGLVNTVSRSVSYANACVSDLPDPSYKPFILSGLGSLTGDLKDQQKVQILRDTGVTWSFILSDVVPLSDDSFCGSSVLVQGIEMGFVFAHMC